MTKKLEEFDYVDSDKQVIHEPDQVKTPNELIVGLTYVMKKFTLVEPKIIKKCVNITDLDFENLKFYFTAAGIGNDFEYFEDMGLIPYGNNKWNSVNWLSRK